MIVSAFEVRRHDHYRQRYRLLVANLEHKDLEYSIEFHAEKTMNPSFDGFGVLSLTIDEPPVEDTVVFLTNPHVYGPKDRLQRFMIPGRRTGLLELQAPGPGRGDARGFVVLRLPTTRGEPGQTRAIPQTDHSVRVLLNAEAHVTSVPAEFQAGGVTTAHSDGMTHPFAYSIALANGNAEMSIEPDG